MHEREFYEDITDKLSKNAKILVAYNKDILGYNAFYCNNGSNKTAYISLIAVDKNKQNMHIGRSLLESCEDICRNHGMMCLDLEVRKDNIQARSFYEKNSFHIIDEREQSYIMRKELF